MAMTALSKHRAGLLGVALLAATSLALAAKDQTVAISPKDTKVCRGQPQIGLVVEFGNAGKEPVALAFDFVGYVYSYFPEPKVQPGEARAEVGFYGAKPLSSQPPYVVLQPGNSEKREIEIRLPPKPPAGTTHLDLFVIVNSRPQKKNYEGTKVLKGELISPKVRLEYADCAAPQ